MNRIEEMENLINNSSLEINDFRVALIDNSKDALTNALRTSQQRRFCLKENEIVFNGNYGYHCVYYRKPILKQPEVTYTVLLYTVLNNAYDSGRDLYSEIRGLIIPSPDGYSHEILIANYEAQLVIDEQDRLRAIAAIEEMKLKKKQAKDKSNAILAARRLAEDQITDPIALQERAREAVELEKKVKNLLDGERQAGEDYSSSENEEDCTLPLPLGSILDGSFAGGDLLGTAAANPIVKNLSKSPINLHKKNTKNSSSNHREKSVVKSSSSSSKHRHRHNVNKKSSKNYVDKSDVDSTDSDISEDGHTKVVLSVLVP
jgi:hypothetical protein